MPKHKIYVQETIVNGRKKYIYVYYGDMDLDVGGAGAALSMDGYRLVARDKYVEPEGVKIVRLPGEQSILSFYPLILLKGLHAGKVIDLINEYTRILRGKDSKVLCFYPGYRRPAKYYAVPKEGLMHGCWYACGPEHFSEKTTKGHPLSREDYRELG